MKVYLCYEHYDDGQLYKSSQWSRLAKVVDSEKKAKHWAFDCVTQKCRSWINHLESVHKELVGIDEDGPYDEGWKELGYEDELNCYKVQFDSFEPDQKSYTLHDFYGRESYDYYFKAREVE